ncbi:MAG: 7-carboxy-7-deazaguanine synthase QueE [Francisellaceae bacterium]
MANPRIDDYGKTLPIIELYPCLQGEGFRRGRPTIAVRTTGCTHRCYFGSDGGFCDTWYSSIHAIKGKYCFDDIIALYRNNPKIKEMMITGGAPTMHPALINELTHFAKNHTIFTTLETEGSHFVKTDHPIDLLSISPKFSNSIPIIGSKTPKGQIVTDKLIKQHNKHRLNLEAIAQMIDYHRDYQIKIVYQPKQGLLDEIQSFLIAATIPADKVMLMPAGTTAKTMIENYAKVMEVALKQGFSFSGRDHIIAYNDKPGV